MKQVRILYCLFFAIVAILTWSVHNTDVKTYNSCKHIELIKSYNYDAINRAIKVLPTTAYYKNPDHTAELNAQLHELKRVKVQFSPVMCHKSLI